MLSIPPRLRELDNRPILSLDLEKSLGARIFPVHRLDLEVSGIILYALNAEAHRVANLWFENRQVTKTYEAFTDSVVCELDSPQLWRSRLLRGKKRAYERPFGKPAETLATPRLEREKEGTKILEWWLEPKTGRPHQLRFELSKHGAPVLGDVLYGSTTPFIQGAIALRSVRLDFSQCEGRDELGIPQTLEVSGIWEWLKTQTPA